MALGFIEKALGWHWDALQRYWDMVGWYQEVLSVELGCTGMYWDALE